MEKLILICSNPAFSGALLFAIGAFVFFRLIKVIGESGNDPYAELYEKEIIAQMIREENERKCS